MWSQVRYRFRSVRPAGMGKGAGLTGRLLGVGLVLVLRMGRLLRVMRLFYFIPNVDILFAVPRLEH